jgi:hypothetical protein
MAETRKSWGTLFAASMGHLTAQEARLLSLIAGLLLLGLAVRFVHLRADHSRVLPAATPHERSVP